LYKHITQRLSDVLKICSEVESWKCFAIKTTLFHFIVDISTNHTPLMMNSFTMTSVLTSNICHGFYKLYYCYLRVVYFARVGQKTQPAQKLLVRIKFTGNTYSYVCERPPLKYTQTCVCQNSYMGYLDSAGIYSCLYEGNLMIRAHSFSGKFCQIL